MITIGSRVRIIAPGRRYDDMRGVITRKTQGSYSDPTLYHVTLDAQFITALGESADGVWLLLGPLRELKTVTSEVDA